MAITMEEILMGRVKFEDCDAETQANLLDLHKKANLLRDKIGRPLKINDGLRRRGIDKPKNGAEKSTHYLGCAIDIDDDDTAWLWKWCLANLEFIHSIGFWMEHPGYTHSAAGTWMHFQTKAPGSGKFIYIPSSAPNPNPKLWDGKYDKKFDNPA